MADKSERRFFSGELELRDIEGNSPVLVGHAAVFNQEADIGGFREMIAPGAFTRSIEERRDVVALFNHSPNLVLGRTSSGTCVISEDESGLAYEIQVPDTQVGRDVHTLVKRGDVRGSSFAFRVPKGGDSWTRGENGQSDLRLIREVELHDVSPCTMPAYEGTSVIARCFPDGVPDEVRSHIETRPYTDTGQVPDYVPADKKKQWLEVWNSAYAKAKGDGESDKDAEASAFAQANGVVKNRESGDHSNDELRDGEIKRADGDDLIAEGKSGETLAEERIGAVLNARNKERLTNAQGLIQEVLDTASEKEPVAVNAAPPAEEKREDVEAIRERMKRRARMAEIE